MISCNVGALDSTLRILAGAAVLSLVWFGPQSAWGYLGLIPLASGSAGFCPLYALFHHSTATHATRSNHGMGSMVR